jgi:hypothetical protein
LRWEFISCCPFPSDTITQTTGNWAADDGWFTCFGECKELANSALTLEFARRLANLLEEKAGDIASNAKIRCDDFAHVYRPVRVV